MQHLVSCLDVHERELRCHRGLDAYLVVNIAILRLHDLNSCHLCILHPFDVIWRLDLEVRIVVFRVLEIQIVDQETLLLGWGSFGKGRICCESLPGLVF